MVRVRSTSDKKSPLVLLVNESGLRARGGSLYITDIRSAQTKNVRAWRGDFRMRNTVRVRYASNRKWSAFGEKKCSHA